MLKKLALSAAAAALLLAAQAQAQTAQTTPAEGAPGSKCRGTEEPGARNPTPADPYPMNAAGWGGEAGGGLYTIRWAEDWTGIRAAGAAPAFKAMDLGAGRSLTLSAELRLRYDVYDNAQLIRRNDFERGLVRGVIGADLRFNPNVRVYGEIGMGQIKGREDEVGANFRNDASLQQLFVDVRGHYGSTLLGVMAGRQEFADGPRQLISISDGPNLHRTWNGVRFYAHGERARFGGFDFRATRLGRGAFDEDVNHAERLQGLNASFIVSRPEGPNTYLEPFWIHSENPAYRSGGVLGLDDRDTVGARLWGRRGDLRFDWTVARQTGDYMGRPVEAWGVFAVQSFSLSDEGWKPRITGRVDIASGGGAYGSGELNGFNPLYASSNYLGDGQFLSLSNLLLIAPGLAVSPTSNTSVSVEYGFARRLEESDAAYAGQMRPYTGTQAVAGKGIGGLLRIGANWNVSRNLTLSLDFEQMSAGQILRRAGLRDGSYGYVGATYRY